MITTLLLLLLAVSGLANAVWLYKLTRRVERLERRK